MLVYVEVDMCVFFNDTATTEIYTLSLHDALPICAQGIELPAEGGLGQQEGGPDRQRCPDDRNHRNRTDPAHGEVLNEDRKSTRLNSSHANISYAVFCLKKKTKATSQFNTLALNIR